MPGKKLTKAMILAAGYGTRLKPHTDVLPKALVQYNNKPMIEHVILKLISAEPSGFIELIFILILIFIVISYPLALLFNFYKFNIRF